MATHTWVSTAFLEVPRNVLIRRCCLIRLKKSSTCQRASEFDRAVEKKPVFQRDFLLSGLAVGDVVLGPGHEELLLLVDSVSSWLMIVLKCTRRVLRR